MDVESRSGTDACNDLDNVLTGFTYTCLDCIIANSGDASDCSETESGNLRCACKQD